MTGVLALAWALRVILLGDKAVWWDEAWSVWVSQHGLRELTEMMGHDAHPPFYQWLLYGWLRLTGISEFAVRALSALAGLLTVAAVYPLTRRLGGSRGAAGLAAFFIALSIFHIRWSQETRMYAVGTALVALATYAYLRAGERWSGWWVLLILTGAALPLTHYLGGFVLIILNLHWLLTWRSRARAFHTRWIAAMLLIALIDGAWALYAYGRIRSGGGTADAALLDVFQLSFTLLAVGQSINLTRYTAVTLAFALVLALGLAWRRNRRGTLLPLLALLLPPGIIVLLSMPWSRFYAPQPEERYFVIFVPLVYAGLGLALDALRRVARAAGLTVIVALALVYGVSVLDALDRRYFQDDYQTLLAAAAALVEPGDAVFFISGERYPLVYYNLDRATGAQPPFEPVGVPADEGEPVESLMGRTIGQRERFWLVEIEAGLGDPQGARRAWIDARYQRVYHTRAGYNGLSLYSRSGDDNPPASAAIVPPVMREARPGDTVRIGVPGGVRVDLLRGEQVLAAQTPASWALVEFPIYPIYAPGEYSLRAADEVYSFRVTHSQSAPGDPAVKLDADFGALRLLGYRLDGLPVRPGEPFDLVLTWQAEAQPDADYTVFAHLLGPPHPETGSIVWATGDSYPTGTPTTAWWPGLTAADRRTIEVPDDLPPGYYSVEVGLYRLDGGERLTLPDGSDRVLIPGIEVRNCRRVLDWCF
ncbi:MAG: phospholipid carrier-dependent glycosyltransferase [Chloroflexi bacterium]|nr:phospholipid carrier-dependent glycosyltransferase [Chloroflexota bacterium]